MTDINQVAIYARVSTERQAESHTIESQVAALVERVAADQFELPDEMRFLDEGYSGATLLRPALDRLRDLSAVGGIDRIYIHSPDRLARNYAYQVLVTDEFERCGVEVVYLNRPLGNTPEDNLLLQMQGMMAEYERAKINERHRRGKRHAANCGSVSVLGCAPYGYRYVPRHEGGGIARYEVVPEEARVVRQLFEWVGMERLTITNVRRKLENANEVTRTGKKRWNPSSIYSMLKNPTYTGSAVFGKTRVGPMRERFGVRRGSSPYSKNGYSSYPVPPEEWITIPVPPIVDPQVFESVQEQLRENKRLARCRSRGATYLLQGLLTCSHCGYSFCGSEQRTRSVRGEPRNYSYYRCVGRDGSRFGGQPVCSNALVRIDTLDALVWANVRSILENPERVETEYRRRLLPNSSDHSSRVSSLDAQLAKLRRGLARLIDSYAACLIDKAEFEPRVTNLKQRITSLEADRKRVVDEQALQSDLRLIVGRLEEFKSRVANGLDSLDWSARRDIIRTLVRRIELDQEKVNIVFMIAPLPLDSGSQERFLQDCPRRMDVVALRILNNGYSPDWA
jgi:site-specific DNA recombinase